MALHAVEFVRGHLSQFIAVQVLVRSRTPELKIVGMRMLYGTKTRDGIFDKKQRIDVLSKGTKEILEEE